MLKSSIIASLAAVLLAACDVAEASSTPDNAETWFGEYTTHPDIGCETARLTLSQDEFSHVDNGQYTMRMEFSSILVAGERGEHNQALVALVDGSDGKLVFIFKRDPSLAPQEFAQHKDVTVFRVWGTHDKDLTEVELRQLVKTEPSKSSVMFPC